MKNIIVTGANQGIGYYFVRQLLKDGYHVTVLDLEINHLEELKEENLLLLNCDVSNLERVKECVAKSAEHFGTIDGAVHNACLCTFDSMENTENEVYKKVFETNYFGALNVTRAVTPFMKKQNKGKVIFTSSGVGVMGFVNISPYASSKGAIEALAKCMSIEYADSNISFHIFHPPLTNTKSAGPLPVPTEFKADPEKVGIGLAKNIEKNSYIICHSFPQKLQALGCYLFPLKMGKFMSKMTANYAAEQEQKNK